MQKSINKSQKQFDHRNELILEDLKVTKEELVESMYLTFSKKIRKNTIKLIIDLREEIIFLTKNITSLKKKNKKSNNNKINNNMYDGINIGLNTSYNFNSILNDYNYIVTNKHLLLNINYTEYVLV